MPFDSSLNVPKQYRAGKICKYCYKILKKKNFRDYYDNRIDKSLRNNEPIKKVCSECKKTFWTGRYKQQTCCLECARLRKNRLERLKCKIKRIKRELMK